MSKEDMINLIHSSILVCLGIEYAEIFLTSKSPVKVGKDIKTGCDFIISTQDLWNRTHINKGRDEPLICTVESEFGVIRSFVYNNVKELANAICDNLPEKEAKLYLAFSGVDEKGNIQLLTKSHNEWHFVSGRLLCQNCGSCFKGQRGLRVHQVLNHNINYSEAAPHARESETQLVKFVNDSSVLIKWEKEKREEEEKSRNGFIYDEGLEACKKGDLEKIVSLVKTKGYDVHNSKDRNNCTSLLWAAGNGHLDICKFLVNECDVDIHELRGKPGIRRSVIHWAARNGHINVVEWLIFEKKIHVDIQTEDGTSSIHFAAYNNQFKMCEFLVEVCGCNVNILNSFGCNTSQWLAYNNNTELMDYFKGKHLNYKLLNNNGHSCLHKAAIKGNLDAVVWLMKKEEDGGGGLTYESHGGKDKDGFCPYAFAKNNGHEKLAKFLLDFI